MNKKKYWIYSGIFMGLASLARTVLIGVSISLGFILLYKGVRDIFRGSRKKLTAALLFLITVSFIIAPWIIRNSIVFKTPVIGSSLTGYNIFRMNFIIANDIFYPHYVGPNAAHEALLQLIEKSNLTGHENEAQMQNFYMNAGLQIIKEHPFRYIILSLYRFLVLWFNTSVKAGYNTPSNLTDYIATFQQAILLIAVIVGAIGNYKKYWAFIICIVLGSLAYMAIGAQLRYLVDLMPAIIVLSALAIQIHDS